VFKEVLKPHYKLDNNLILTSCFLKHILTNIIFWMYLTYRIILFLLQQLLSQQLVRFTLHSVM